MVACFSFALSCLGSVKIIFEHNLKLLIPIVWKHRSRVAYYCAHASILILYLWITKLHMEYLWYVLPIECIWLWSLNTNWLSYFLLLLWCQTFVSICTYMYKYCIFCKRVNALHRCFNLIIYWLLIKKM